jgi:dihydroflavonol-4-reductase
MTHRSDHSPQGVRTKSIATGSPLRRVAVTGATGLLGGAIIAELLSRGIEVLAVARNETRARQLLGNRDGLHLVVGDMLEVRALEPQLRGVDAIVHAAAYFREYYQRRIDLALLDRTNVAAVGELIDSRAMPMFPSWCTSAAPGHWDRDHRSTLQTRAARRGKR